MKSRQIPVNPNLRYDENSSTFLTRSTKKGEEPAGSRNGRYMVVKVAGQTYLIHRVVWTYLKGEIPEGYEVEHRDGNRYNNNISNLRLATRAQNCQNRSGFRNRPTSQEGLPKGVRLVDEERGLYKAYVKKDYKLHSYYSTNLEEAVFWVQSKREELHGEFHKH